MESRVTGWNQMYNSFNSIPLKDAGTRGTNMEINIVVDRDNLSRKTRKMQSMLLDSVVQSLPIRLDATRTMDEEIDFLFNELISAIPRNDVEVNARKNVLSDERWKIDDQDPVTNEKTLTSIQSLSILEESVEIFKASTINQVVENAITILLEAKITIMEKNGFSINIINALKEMSDKMRIKDKLGAYSIYESLIPVLSGIEHFDLKAFLTQVRCFYFDEIDLF
jgi:hypothetical protein